jgi:2-alkenal reductase
MQFEIPTFAEANEKKEVLDAAKMIQQADEKEQKEKKKVSEVIDEVNQSVVAIIGNNSKYREQDDTYSKYPKNLQHGSGVVIEKDGKILTITMLLMA